MTGSGWVADRWPERPDVHVVPVGDGIEHEADECVCGPASLAVRRRDGSVGWIVRHSALDGREASEPTTGTVAWLMSALDAAEAGARRALRASQDAWLRLQDPRLLGTPQPGWYLLPGIEAVAAWMLGDIAAKRRVLAWHAAECRECSGIGCVTMRLLATGYADHPGFRAEWRTE